jgi:hypothetical protein
MRSGTVIPNKLNAFLMVLATALESCTLNLISVAVSAPKIDTF